MSYTNYKGSIGAHLSTKKLQEIVRCVFSTKTQIAKANKALIERGFIINIKS